MEDYDFEGEILQAWAAYPDLKGNRPFVQGWGQMQLSSLRPVSPNECSWGGVIFLSQRSDGSWKRQDDFPRAGSGGRTVHCCDNCRRALREKAVKA